MRHHEILTIYLEQISRANKSPYAKAKELKKFVTYCLEKHEDLIDYNTVQSWLELRGKTVNHAGLAHIQNQISDFTEWAYLLDKTVGRVPKARKVKANRRRSVILNCNQVREIIIEQRACISKKNITPRTFSVITGLLFVTGMRINEAINLETSFVDLKARSIYVPCGKSPRDRVIPISISTCKVLKDYAEWREKVRPNSNVFFVHNKIDVKYPYKIYLKNFIQVVTKLGHRTPTSEGRRRGDLRIHDLRHSFAVNSLIKIYDEGVDVNEAIIQLSSILGHKSLDGTYWYIEAIPELIAAAFKGELS